MNFTMRRWMAILCAMLLAANLAAASTGASAEAAAAGTELTQASDDERNDQAEMDALTASAKISQPDAEKAFQALYPDWS